MRRARRAVFEVERRRLLARWGFAACIVGSPLAIGSVHTPVLCIVALAVAAVVAVAYWDARPTPARRAASIVVVTGVALCAWTLVQQLPLPMSVLEAIAPANADIWSRALSPLREPGPAWAPISLDPVATRIHFLRGVVAVLAFLAALRIASQTAGVKFLERTLLASAVVLGIAAAVHPLFGLDRVFGVIKPMTADFGTRLAPLLNSNHLAAYLNVGACVALAWSLSRRSRVHGLVPFGIFLALVALQVVVASRGGVAATILGSATVVWLVRRSGDERRTVPWTIVAGGALAAIVVVAFVLKVRTFSMSELTSDDTVKLSIIRQALGTVKTFPWVGLGRGAFEGVFPAFRSDGEGNVAFTHPENIVVQWCAEWGAPLGLAALIAIVVALRPSVALARSSVPVGPSAGLFAVGVHNLIDFSAEIPAVAIALATCAACVVGGAADVRRDTRPALWVRRPRWTVAVASAVTLGAVLGAWQGVGKELREDREALRVLALGSPVDRTAFAAAARAAMLRHPAEPYLPLMGAVRAARVGDENPIPWIARTLERASVYGRAHLLLARLLHVRSPGQARLEYRLAMEQDYNLIEPAIAGGAQLVETGDDALQLIPEGRLDEIVLEQLANKLRSSRPAAARRLDEELARRNPDSTVVARLAVESAIESLRSDACAPRRSECTEQALEAAARYIRVAPSACAGHRAHAEILVESGQVGKAFTELDRAIDGLADRGGCARYLVEIASRLDDDRRVGMALERMLAAGCSNDAECASTYLHASQVEETRKNSRRALAHATRASERAPERNDILAVVARLSSATGDHAAALEAYLTLQGREPSNRAWSEGAAAERAALDTSRRRILGLEAGAP